MATSSASSTLRAARSLTRNATFLSQHSPKSTPGQTTNTVSSMASVVVQHQRDLPPHANAAKLKPKSLLSPAPAPLPSTAPSISLSSSSVVSRSTTTLRVPRPLTNTASLQRPLPNSYWATPYLVACEYPWSPSCPSTTPSCTTAKLSALLAAGVRTFIDLTEAGELLSYASLLPALSVSLSSKDAIEYHRYAIPDRSLPPPLLVPQLLALLQSLEQRGRVAAIHCRGGIGRTGTIVGCWLVQSGRVRDGTEALDAIAKEWRCVEKCRRFPVSPETGAQAEYVRTFRRIDLARVNAMGAKNLPAGSSLKNDDVVGEDRIEARW